MPEHYKFDGRDRALLRAAAVLLKKVANAETLRPAELVSVAKLQHVLSVLPRVTPDLEVTVSVVAPRRKFGEIETWHYWDIGIEGEQITIASGGHFDQPSTGGDSFTTMNWTAVPEEPAELEDYRETLWMVPDVQSFPEAVAGIEFSSGAYRIEITDSENTLLQEGEETGEDAYEAEGPSSEEVAFIELYRRQEMLELRSADWEMAASNLQRNGLDARATVRGICRPHFLCQELRRRGDAPCWEGAVCCSRSRAACFRIRTDESRRPLPRIGIRRRWRIHRRQERCLRRRTSKRRL